MLLCIISDLAGLDQVADVLGGVLPVEMIINEDDGSGSLPAESKRCRFLQNEDKRQ